MRVPELTEEQKQFARRWRKIKCGWEDSFEHLMMQFGEEMKEKEIKVGGPWKEKNGKDEGKEEN